MEQGSRRKTASATSARRRVQVGTTNRPLPSSRIPSSPAPASKGERGASTDRSDEDSKGNRYTSRLRRIGASSSFTAGGLRRPGTPSNAKDGLNIGQNQDDASRRVQALALCGRDSAQAESQSHKREPLSTSRSMPALGTAPGLPDDTGGGSSRGVNTTSATNTGLEATSTTMKISGRSGEEEGSRPPADDFYLSSTRLSYMSGLHTPESKVPVLDPYRYSTLLHERWINRASHRLAALANIKYGSIRDFFRLYDSNFDGVLDFDEFSKGITMCQLDHLFPRSLQRSLFDKIDKDKSGTIDLSEFATFLSRGQQGVTASVSAWQKQEQQRKSEDTETRSVQLQPINDYKAQRIKNRLCHCLNKAVPHSSTGLADNRTMFLQKQFAFLHDHDKHAKEVEVKDLAKALGPRGMNIGVNEEDVKLLVDAMDVNRDGKISLKEFATFLNLDDHDPLYQPLFDGRRRTVNILQSTADSPPPGPSAEEKYIQSRVNELHSATVPSKTLDEAVRAHRNTRDDYSWTRTGTRKRDKNAPDGVFGRPESAAWTTSQDFATVPTPSARKTVVDIWDLPPPTRHLSSTKRSLTSAMRSLPRSVSQNVDTAKVAFGSEGGPAEEASKRLFSIREKQALSSMSSSGELFSSLQEEQMQAAAVGAMARSRKVPKPTWADVGHGGIGLEAGTDENSSFYACPEERFTTTYAERFGPMLKEKKIEKGQRSAGFRRERRGDAAAGAAQRLQQSEDRSCRLREHQERVALNVKAEEVAARIKGERRVRGKVRTRLRYLKWINGQDNWLRDEVPKLADFDKRQFPEQNIRLRGGQQMHEVLGGPRAMNT